MAAPKLSTEQIAYIRRRYAERTYGDQMAAALAQHFGVSQNTIFTVVRPDHTPKRTTDKVNKTNGTTHTPAAPKRVPYLSTLSKAELSALNKKALASRKANKEKRLAEAKAALAKDTAAEPLGKAFGLPRATVAGPVREPVTGGATTSILTVIREIEDAIDDIDDKLGQLRRAVRDR